MDLTNIILWTIVGVAVVLGALAIFSTSTGKDIPRYPARPPAPTKKYRLLVSELQEGEYYHLMLSDKLVKLKTVYINPERGNSAEAIHYRVGTDEWVGITIRDNDLYTEDINLAPRAKAEQQRRHDELVKEVLGKDYTYTGTHGR